MFESLFGKKMGAISVAPKIEEVAPMSEPTSLKEMAGEMALKAISANDGAGFAKAICLIVEASELSEEEY